MCFSICDVDNIKVLLDSYYLLQDKTQDTNEVSIVQRIRDHLKPLFFGLNTPTVL